MDGNNYDPPLSILKEEVAEFSRIVLGGEDALPFWVTKERAIHHSIYRIMSILNHVERYGNSWEGFYPGWR